MVSGGSISGQAWVTRIALFLTGGVALLFPSGFSLGPAFLLLTGMWALVGRSGVKPDSSGPTIRLLFACGAYGLVLGSIDAWHGEGIAAFDGFSRFFLMIPMVWAIWATRPPLTWLFSGLAFGAVGAALVAVWDVFHLDLPRATGFTQIIQFGNIALLLGVLSLAGLGLAGTVRWRKTWISLMLAGAAGGFCASVLSGTRGGWVSLPVAALCLIWSYRALLLRHWRRAVILMLIGGAMLVVAGTRLGVGERVQEAFSDVERYVERGDGHSPLGARFDMWRFAWHLAPERPLFGWGQKGYHAERDRQLASGTAPETVRDFGHVHNEMLDHLLKYGAVGLALLMSMYLLSLLLHVPHLSAQDAELRVVAQSGVLVTLMFMIFGLSQVSFAHNSGRMVFAALTIILAAFLPIHAQARSNASTSNF